MTRPFVSTAWLADHLDDEDVVVVDGSWYLPAQNRDPDAEFLSAHIPGAVRFDIDVVKDASSPLPHMLPKPDAFAAAAGGLGIGNDTRVIVYDGAGLFSAPRVWWTFRIFGGNPAILEGGLPKWTNEKRPLESGTARSREARIFVPRFDAAQVAGAADVHRALAEKIAQVVDARPAERFRGEAPEPRPGIPSGHMPGSCNVPSAGLIRDGQLKPLADLMAAFEKAGVDISRPVITSCGSGVSAAILSLALETLGRPAAALYDGSWSEWASRRDAPIEKA